MLDLLLELVIQVFVEGLFEVSTHVLSKRSVGPKLVNRFLAAIIYLGLGGLAGVIITLFFPYRLFRRAPVPGLSLLIIPILAALTMVGVGWLRRQQGMQLVRLDRFAYAYLFAFGMALARFTFVL